MFAYHRYLRKVLITQVFPETRPIFPRPSTVLWQCAPSPHELPKYRACLLSVIAGYELQTEWDIQTRLTALLAMAPVRRYRVGALPAHRHGLTLAGQLASRRQPDRRRAPPPLPPASTNKVLKWELFGCWQDELELLQSLATSDGSWPDELLPCPPSPPSDSSAAPSLVASSEDDDDWGSPPSSPRVTPALIARLSVLVPRRSCACPSLKLCRCVCVYACRGIVEPSGFRVLGIVGALGDTFQQNTHTKKCAIATLFFAHRSPWSASAY